MAVAIMTLVANIAQKLYIFCHQCQNSPNLNPTPNFWQKAVARLLLQDEDHFVGFHLTSGPGFGVGALY